MVESFEVIRAPFEVIRAPFEVMVESFEVIRAPFRLVRAPFGLVEAPAGLRRAPVTLESAPGQLQLISARVRRAWVKQAGSHQIAPQNMTSLTANVFDRRRKSTENRLGLAIHALWMMNGACAIE